MSIQANHIAKFFKGKYPWVLPVVLFLSAGFVNAQHALQFSQYFSNQLVINPAYAGADDALSLTLVHRNQWAGVNGAPRTTTLSGHMLFKNEHTGLGINLVVDEINIHRTLSVTGIYSYRIKLNARSYLSFGLQAGYNHIRSDYTSLAASLQNPDDPHIASGNVSESAVQFGTGIYYKSPRLELGLSAPILHSTSVSSITPSLTLPGATPHYFLFSRYKWDLSHHVQIHPGFLLKYKPDWPLSVDLNMDALIKEVLLVGFSYRSFETLCSILQLKILPQMKFGYSYDMPLKNGLPRNFNTHEIMLNYVFHYKNYNLKNPR
jgi:type IX secretion system PorP/SprF family membrane protein